MRTTLEIEDDILQAAKEIAVREKTTAGRIISKLARRGLAGSGRKMRRIEYRNGVPLLPRRDCIVTLEQVDRIKDEEGI